MKNYSKYANWYDQDGNIVNKKDKYGCTRNYTISEVEELLDKLAQDKDENGKVRNPQALNNVNAVLFQMYQKYGNPHEKEIIEAVKKAQERKTTEKEKENALQEVASELDRMDNTTANADDIFDGKHDDRLDDSNGEYVEFEEIKA